MTLYKGDFIMAFEMTCGMTFAQFFGMRKKEKEAYHKAHPFTYENIDEYIKDVCKWLTLSDWHYSEEEAMRLIKMRAAWIEECYDCQAPIDLAGAEAGYCCG